ncbi:hypothetical protein EZV62_019633 [Acer yangbiense]|uniref:xyloglucan:xyloglucosyl transferase n=1 Tax=Acer yangbiense TaxID=1000413 RepID=A0A5C7HBS4_9ROSI|nr:hypothetical protein EZV62_019633 [Acer yangbiense]
MMEKLDRMFMNTIATMDHAWAPSSSVLPSDSSNTDTSQIESTTDSNESIPVDVTQNVESVKNDGNKRMVNKFLVDNVPIRVFKNNTKNGVSYPSKPMHIMASVWGPSWTGHIDWSQAPFQAHYQRFHVDGCVLNDSDIPKCFSSEYWLNNNELWELNPQHRRSYQNVRQNYLTYDYCSDRSRYPKPPPECQLNQ